LRLKHEIANKACLDDLHQDQLLIYMALADGKSRINIGKHQSDHTKSMIYVIDKFLPEAKIHFQDGILEIDGINYFGKI
jgi:RNA 3'-terminal phosphate cyclase (ATP)